MPTYSCLLFERTEGFITVRYVIFGFTCHLYAEVLKLTILFLKNVFLDTVIQFCGYLPHTSTYSSVLVKDYKLLFIPEKKRYNFAKQGEHEQKQKHLPFKISSFLSGGHCSGVVRAQAAAISVFIAFKNTEPLQCVSPSKYGGLASHTNPSIDTGTR